MVGKNASNGCWNNRASLDSKRVAFLSSCTACLETAEAKRAAIAGHQTVNCEMVSMTTIKCGAITEQYTTLKDDYWTRKRHSFRTSAMIES
jgi:hypothetical protein